MKLDEKTKKFIVSTILEILNSDVKILLFGSYAKNQANAKSDVDISIDMKSPIPTNQWSEIEAIFENSYLQMKIDVIDFQRVTPEFKNLILNEGRELNSGKIN